MWQTKKLKGKKSTPFLASERFDRSFYSVNKKSNVVDFGRKKKIYKSWVGFKNSRKVTIKEKKYPLLIFGFGLKTRLQKRILFEKNPYHLFGTK